MIAMELNKAQVQEIRVELSKAAGKIGEAIANIHHPMISMDESEIAKALADALQSVSVALVEISRPIKE